MAAAIAGPLALAAIGVALLAYAARLLWRLRVARGWVPVSGVVVRSWLAETEDLASEGQPVWQLNAVYEFAWEGEPRRGSVVSPDPLAYRFPSHKRALRHLARWPAGAKVLVHVGAGG